MPRFALDPGLIAAMREFGILSTTGRKAASSFTSIRRYRGPGVFFEVVQRVGFSDKLVRVGEFGGSG